MDEATPAAQPPPLPTAQRVERQRFPWGMWIVAIVPGLVSFADMEVDRGSAYRIGGFIGGYWMTIGIAWLAFLTNRKAWTAFVAAAVWTMFQASLIGTELQRYGKAEATWSAALEQRVPRLAEKWRSFSESGGVGATGLRTRDDIAERKRLLTELRREFDELRKWTEPEVGFRAHVEQAGSSSFAASKAIARFESSPDYMRMRESMAQHDLIITSAFLMLWSLDQEMGKWQVAVDGTVAFGEDASRSSVLEYERAAERLDRAEQKLAELKAAAVRTEKK